MINTRSLLNVNAQKWSVVLYSESWKQPWGRWRNSLFLTQKLRCLWMWGGKKACVKKKILSCCPLAEPGQCESVHHVVMHIRVKVVFKCLQQSDWLLHLPKWSSQSVISPSLASYVKTDVLWTQCIYLTFVMVHLVCIIIRTHFDDMDCNDSARTVTGFMFRF